MMLINVHGLFFAMGAIVTALVYQRLRRDITMSRAAAETAVILLAGLLGARLAYGLLYGATTLLDYLSFWQAGLISYGGLILGGLALAWLQRRAADRRHRLDCFALAVLPGWAVGRVGNFWFRDAYGVANPIFNGSVFYGRVPIQLYESLALMLLFAAGLWLRRRRPTAGWLFWYSLAGYSLARLLIDHWRDLPPIWWTLNASQLVSLGLFLYAMVGLQIWPRKIPPR